MGTLSTVNSLQNKHLLLYQTCLVLVLLLVLHWVVLLKRVCIYVSNCIGIMALLSSLTCNFFRENAVINYEFGLNGPVTDRYTFLEADTNMVLTNYKQALRIHGAPYTTQMENKRAKPDGRLYTILAVVIYKQISGAPEGQINLDTFQQASGTKENVPLYTAKDDVIHGCVYRYRGFDDCFNYAWGFRNGTRKITLQVKDTLRVAMLGSDNMNNWKESFAGNKGDLSGSISWEIYQQQQSISVPPSQIV